jgi:hypothetical protein
MARRFLRRRTLVIGAIIVVLSVGIVFASIPYLPHPHNSIVVPQSYTVAGGSQTYPGFHALSLPGISNGENFAVGVTANETTSFCVIQDSPYESWAQGGSPTWATFPWSDCILQELTAQGTLSFTANSSGAWDVATLNTNPTAVTVGFFPA